MNRKTIFAGLMIFSAITVCLYAADSQDNAALRIYLPREMTIENSRPTLQQVAILRGSETVTDQAGAVTLGQLSVPDQNLVIDRQQIMSRLACNGINAGNVSFTGAEEVTVKRRHQCITGNEFAEKATKFLKDNLPNEAICQLTPVRLPNDLIIPGTDKAMNLTCQVISLRGNQCKVRTTTLCDGQEIASRDTIFLCQYKCRKAFAKTSIEKGQTITSDNADIREATSNTPEPTHWTPPYGQIAKRNMAVDTEIKSHMVTPATPEVVLKRNQTVTIMINCPGFVASATGKALQDGATGEFIKVKNIDSQKVIMAKVIGDGTVEPIF